MYELQITTQSMPQITLCIPGPHSKAWNIGHAQELTGYVIRKCTLCSSLKKQLPNGLYSFFVQSRQRKNTCMNENCLLFSKWRRKNIYEQGDFILITRINKVHVADPLLHTTNQNICTFNTKTDRGSSLNNVLTP